uniref:Uncharacterized protein n=1 Tax=Eutreptiella gymnastica TaxID=73025 RepID=A0A7S4CEK6_9EUGL
MIILRAGWATSTFMVPTLMPVRVFGTGVLSALVLRLLYDRRASPVTWCCSVTLQLVQDDSRWYCKRRPSWCAFNSLPFLYTKVPCTYHIRGFFLSKIWGFLG